MLSYTDSYKLVEEHLEHLAYNREPNQLYEPIQYILSIGGKRIRPCLSLMAHSLFSDKRDEVLESAIGIEVFHNFTLLHDDIMDNAPVRRNYPTVHSKWNANVAILSGDAMLILAYQMVARTRADILPHMLDLFNQTALEVCEGQQYDMNFETRNNVTVAEYLEMIRLKTAVLLAASLASGAIAAGAKQSDVDALYDFGLNMGMAFQLQDDYLDAFADIQKFGKTIGGDIVSNKKTFLMLSALEDANAEQKQELNSWLEKENFDADEKIAAVKTVYTDLEIGEKTKKLSEEYMQKALEQLNAVSAPDNMKQELRNVVDMLLKREH